MRHIWILQSQEEGPRLLWETVKIWSDHQIVNIPLRYVIQKIIWELVLVFEVASLTGIQWFASSTTVGIWEIIMVSLSQSLIMCSPHRPALIPLPPMTPLNICWGQRLRPSTLSSCISLHHDVSILFTRFPRKQPMDYKKAKHFQLQLWKLESPLKIAGFTIWEF